MLTCDDMTAKTSYNMLINNVVTPCVIEAKHPLIDFSHAWRQICEGGIAPEAKDLEWRIVHNVLPVNAYLFKLRITKNVKCLGCDWPETLKHCFLSCKIVQPIWTKIEGWMSVLMGVAWGLTPERVLFIQNGTIDNKFYFRFFHIVSSELKLATWRARNERKNEGRAVSTLSLEMQFLYRLRGRIKTDFHRLMRGDFMNIWSLPPLHLATVEEDCLMINF